MNPDANRDRCADCQAHLTWVNRMQYPTPRGLLVFVCPEHYADRVVAS